MSRNRTGNMYFWIDRVPAPDIGYFVDLLIHMGIEGVCVGGTVLSIPDIKDPGVRSSFLFKSRMHPVLVSEE